MAVQGAYIADLILLTSPLVQLPGGLFEVEVLTGPVVGAYVSRKLTTEQLVEYLTGMVGSNLAQVDLLALTGAQMDQVLALTYTDGDAPLAGTPSWSKPGMWFDVKLPNGGGTYRYTCGRGNYTPGVAGSGVGPRWSRLAKL